MKNKSIFILFASLNALASSVSAQDIDLSGYTLTFEDNFDVLSVSPDGSNTKGAKTWYHFPPTGAAGNYGVNKWYVAQMSCTDGILNIRASWNAATNRWQSGQLASMDKSKIGFAQKYGYFSCRMQMPVAGTGAWPAFWLLGIDHIPNRFAKALEIDVLEWYGNQPDKAYQRQHCWNPDNSDSGGQFPLLMTHPPDIPGGNASGQYHIYGVLVTPDFITWFIDGVQTQKSATPTSYHTDLFVMIDYALGGGWPLTGEPYASKGPSSLLVDWVRVYSLPPEPPPPMPTPTPEPTPTPVPTPTPGLIKGYFQGNIEGIFIPVP